MKKQYLITTLAILIGFGLVFYFTSQAQAASFKGGDLIRRKSGGTVYRVKKDKSEKTAVVVIKPKSSKKERKAILSTDRAKRQPFFFKTLLSKRKAKKKAIKIKSVK